MRRLRRWATAVCFATVIALALPAHSAGEVAPPLLSYAEALSQVSPGAVPRGPTTERLLTLVERFPTPRDPALVHLRVEKTFGAFDSGGVIGTTSVSASSTAAVSVDLSVELPTTRADAAHSWLDLASAQGNQHRSSGWARLARFLATGGVLAPGSSKTWWFAFRDEALPRRQCLAGASLPLPHLMEVEPPPPKAITPPTRVAPDLDGVARGDAGDDTTTSSGPYSIVGARETHFDVDHDTSDHLSRAVETLSRHGGRVLSHRLALRDGGSSALGRPADLERVNVEVAFPASKSARVFVEAVSEALRATSASDRAIVRWANCTERPDESAPTPGAAAAAAGGASSEALRILSFGVTPSGIADAIGLAFAPPQFALPQQPRHAAVIEEANAVLRCVVDAGGDGAGTPFDSAAGAVALRSELASIADASRSDGDDDGAPVTMSLARLKAHLGLASGVVESLGVRYDVRGRGVVAQPAASLSRAHLGGLRLSLAALIRPSNPSLALPSQVAEPAPEEWGRVGVRLREAVAHAATHDAGATGPLFMRRCELDAEDANDELPPLSLHSIVSLFEGKLKQPYAKVKFGMQRPGHRA